jgi:Transglycosylase SLT domain
VAETIKEYLVSLGWKVDEASQRRFMSAVSGAIEPVAKLTATATGAVTAIETMVATTAKSMNDLYYSALRTGVAAQTLQDIAFAAQQVGSSAKDGTSLVEAFSNAFQINPGSVQLFKDLGGSVESLNGRLAPTEQGLASVVRRLAAMPRYEAIQYLQDFGISLGQAVNILNNPEGFIAAMQQARDIATQLGTNMQEATAKGRSFSNEWARFGYIVGDVWTNVFNKIEPVSEKILKVVDDNALEFGKFSHELGDVPAVIATVLASLQGVVTTLGVVGGAIGGFSGGPIGMLKGAISGLAESFAAIPRIAASVLGVLSRFASNPIIAFLMAMHPTSTQTGIGGGTHETEAGKAYAEQNSVPSPPHSTWSTRGTWNKIRGWFGLGPTSAAPARTPPGPSTDGSGYLGIFQALEGSGPGDVSKAGAIGRNQLMPATAAAIAKQHGLPFSAAMLFDPAYNDKIAMFLESDLAKQYHNDLDAMAVAYNAGTGTEAAWERSGRNDAVLPAETQKYLAHLHELQRSGAINQSITANINVNGTASAADTAHLVQDAQKSVNADAMRNLQGAVQ